MNQIKITVTASQGIKCPRCWHYHNVSENYDGLCDRCCNTILTDHPEFNAEVTAGIKESQASQRKKYCVRPDDQPCHHEKCCRND